MLDVRRLKVLCEVARRGSLSAAAEALSYTSSAISQQIAALEREVGVSLLERRARGVVLTEAGVLLVSHAELILAQLGAAKSALAELSELRRGQLRLGSFATAGATIVPRAVDDFQSHYPDIDVRVEQATTREGVARLRQGRLDLVLTVDLPPATDLTVEDLFTDPFRLALHRRHPRAGATELRLADLAGERWINVPCEVQGGDVLTAAFARLGLGFEVAYESDDYTAIHELVGAGLGVALLPDLALFPANEDVVLRPLGPDAPSRRIQAVTRRDDVRSPSSTAMLAILRNLEPRRRAPVPDPVQPGATGTPSR
ncbi:MAG: LysR family transcriptional regulator [Actinomycetota bacterium]|nr:LysR family transcriptional regulator [Actinomycetota bacterium]